MKKRNIIIACFVIAIIVCLFVFPMGYADSSGELVYNFGPKNYSTDYAASVASYESIDNCVDGEYFSISVNAVGNIIIKPNGNVPTENGTDTLTCDVVIVNDDGSKSNKTFKGVVKYTTETSPVEHDISLQLSSSSSVFNLGEYYEISKITAINFKGTNIKVDCPVGGSSCTITGINFDGESEYSGTIEFTDTSNQKHSVNVILYMHSNVIHLNGGGYGSCNFADTGWVIDDQNPSLYKKSSGGSLTLPTCTADNSKYYLLEFAGWYPTTVLNVQDLKVNIRDTTIGTCMSAPGFIPKGGNVASGEYNYYFSCYKYVEGFELVPGSGTVTNLSGDYRYVNGEYLVKGSSLVLPNVEPNVDGYKFEGWYDSVTNSVLAPGTSIEGGGNTSPRYLRAKYKRIVDSDTHSYIVAMSRKQTETLENLIGIDGNFSGCTSSNSSIVTVTKKDECMLSTGDNVGSATITTNVKNGDTTDIYIVEVTVYEDVKFSSDFDPSYILGDDDTETEWKDGSESAIGSVSSCDYYYVWSEDDRTDRAVSNIHTFNIYRARASGTGCDTSKQYYALCLDPGLRGPNESVISGVNGHYYKKGDTLNPFTGKQSRESALYYLATQIAGESVSYEKYAAVNFVGRVVQYMYGYNNTSSSSNYYWEQDAAYRAIANANKSCLPNDCKEMELPSGYSFLNYESTIQSYFAGALNAKYEKNAADEHGVTLEKEESTSKWEGTTFVAERKGTLILPEGTKKDDFTFEPSCSLTGYTCEIKSFTQQGTSNKWDFDVVVKIDLNNHSLADLPSTQDKNLAFKLKFKNGKSYGSAFIITHQSYSNIYQRMLLINPGTNDYYMYVNIRIGASCNLDADVLDYRKHCTGEGCDDVIRLDYFMALGCCNKIEDKTSAVFKYLCTGGDCAYSNMLPMCEYSASSSNENDLFNINEATDSFGNEKYQCVVDVDNVYRTDNLQDISGNNFSLAAFDDNRYCRVSCKEDWYISTSAFGNYTADNAILAGSYFQISNDVFIGGSRTCVTTYIDTDKYQSEIKELAANLVTSWNNYSNATSMYDAIEKATVNSNPTYYYNTYKDEKYCAAYKPQKDKDGNILTDEYGNTLYSSECETWSTYKHYSKDGSCTEYSLNVNYNYSKIINTTTSAVGTGIGSYSSETSNTTVGSEGSPGNDGTKGSCGTKDEKALRREGLNVADGLIKDYRAEVSRYQLTIDTYSQAMANCMNFELYTGSDYPIFSDSSSVVSAYGNGVLYRSTYVNMTSPALKIDTEFSPYVEYSYDEEDYMKNLGKDNYMVPYTAANNEMFGGSKDRTVSRNTKEYENVDNTCSSSPVGYTEEGEAVYLCKHKYNTYGYNASISAKENDIYGKNSSATISGSKSLGSSNKSFGQLTLCKTASDTTKIDNASNYCSVATFYYYDIHYVKQTIQNSSFWKNKGNWYLNSNDEKSHGDTLSEAARASYLSVKGNEDLFTPYGGDNVFPISMDTRRNLYQYVYTFYNIGTYNNGDLGRIMGGEKHPNDSGVKETTTVMGYNTHACFYEVYESICRCCGQPITSYVVSSQTTTEYIEENSGFYGESDHDAIYNDATLALYTNSVSLSNLSSSTNRVLGANWQAQTPFYLNGKRYCNSPGGDDGCIDGGTNQGVELLAEIQSVGDEIYNNVPDYSFTLTPGALSEIRDYNDKNSYAIDSTKLTNYGKIAYVAHGSSGYEVKGTEKDYKINFNHYGSKFLEQLKESGYVTDQYKGKTLLDITGGNVCSVTEGEVDKIYSGTSYKNCRWIDYISNNKNEDGSSLQVRLAFK